MADRRERDPECLFCRIVAGEIPADRVLEDDHLVAFRDIAPRAPTHVLVVPREHIPSARELTQDDGDLLAHLFRSASGIARDEGIADAGYRLVVNVGQWGGQSVDHLHLHLLGGRAMTWPPG
jgi:histidine triad (HIT) family protein